MAEEIRFVGDLERLVVRPGDRFVLTVPGMVSVDYCDRIQRAWRDFIGGDAESLKLLILVDGMKLGVLGEPD